MSNKIGIKLADGTFYPVLEEGISQKKKMELTTVHDGQTTVQLDLYKTDTDEISDKTYVDSLLIENLKPRPKEELTLKLLIGLDEDGVLSAEIEDSETGEHKELSVSLVNLDESKRSDTPDYSVAKDAAEKTADGDDESFSDEAFNFDNEESVEKSEDSVFDDTEIDLDKNIGENSSEHISDDDFDFPDFSKVENKEESSADSSSEDESTTHSSDSVFDDDEGTSSGDSEDDDFDSLPDFFEKKDSVSEKKHSRFGSHSHKSAGDDEEIRFDNGDNETSENPLQKNRFLVPVLICCICVLICVAAVICFFIFGRETINFFDEDDINKMKTQKEKTVEEPVNEKGKLPVSDTAREDEIVIVETPVVSPAKPDVVKTEGDVIKYNVKWGDTLWDISKTYYKNPWLYLIIAEYNHLENPDIILAGSTLDIPPR